MKKMKLKGKGMGGGMKSKSTGGTGAGMAPGKRTARPTSMYSQNGTSGKKKM